MITYIDGQNKPGKVFEIGALIKRTSLNIIKRCTFAEDKDTATHKQSVYDTYATIMSEMSGYIMGRVVKPHLAADWIYNLTSEGQEFFKAVAFARGLAKDIILKRREVLKSGNSEYILGNKKYINFLDILLLAKDDDGNGISDTQIVDEVSTFMFAGHDTTSNAISFCLYNIARHPEVQEKAYEEIIGLMDKRNSNEVEWSDFNYVPYLTKCIKESMRLHPPVPDIYRELTEATELSKGHWFPK
jgi:cytochrome P450